MKYSRGTIGVVGLKILVTGPTFYEYSYTIVRALRELQILVDFYPMIEFYRASNYIEHKLYNLGMKKLEIEYNKKWEDGLYDSCVKTKPDLIIVLNGIMMNERILCRLGGYKKCIWLWDSIYRAGNDRAIETICSYFSAVFCFENSDVAYLKSKDINAYYLPLGYDQDIFKPTKGKRDIDISFIGMPNDERLSILESVAVYVKKKRLKMFIGGEWYDKRYIWKRIRFKEKYPNLFPYICNSLISAEQASNVYARSKICLNISIEEHRSQNPRMFEILATKSLCLMKYKSDMHIDFVEGQDFIGYDTNIITKIDSILSDLSHNDEISKHGYNKVIEKYSMNAIIKEMLSYIMIGE